MFSMFSLDNFFYDNPVWFWSTILSSIVLSLVYLLLFITHKFIKPSHELLSDNVLSVGLLQVVSTAYAVLLAFIAFSVLGISQNTSQIVETEASNIGNIFRNINALPPNIAQPIRQNLILYLNHVIDKEWPAQQNATITSVKQVGWTFLDNIGTELTSPALASASPVIQAETLSELNDLYTARQMRILAATETLPNIVWVIVCLGGFVLLSFSTVLGSENFKLKLFLTTLVTLSLLLIITLIIALDRPLRGELSIDAKPYENVKTNLEYMMKEN